MKKQELRIFCIQIIETIIGSFIMAIAVSLFLLPNELSSGGFSGIATIMYYIFKIPMGTTILALNIPLFVFATLKIGRKFLEKSIVGTISLSIFIDILDKFNPLTNEYNIEIKHLRNKYTDIEFCTLLRLKLEK